jgi:integrase
MAGKKNHRRFGHVRRLPSKRWQAFYTGPDTGQHRAPSTFDTRDDAEGWLSAESRLIELSTWTPPKHRQAASERVITFSTYSTTWLADRDLKPRTRIHYRKLLDKHLIPILGEMPVRSITPAVVRSWYALTARDLPTTRAHCYSLLRAILATAVIDELIAANPCHIRGAGSAKRKVEIVPANLVEIEKLVGAMPAKYRLLILLAAWCAMRFGELTELRRKDIDLRAGVIKVRRAVTWVNSKAVVGSPKSDAGSRDVAIPPHLIPLIKQHLADHAGISLVFPSPTGGHLTTSTLYASYWPARKAAGRPDLRFHDLRHTGAVLAAQTGATLAELMNRLGHSTPGAALRYQHTARGRDKEIAAALSRLADGNTPEAEEPSVI